MKVYAKDERVRELWDSEKGSNSYFGLEFPPTDH
jgi:hypothetical protein